MPGYPEVQGPAAPPGLDAVPLSVADVKGVEEPFRYTLIATGFVPVIVALIVFPFTH